MNSVLEAFAELQHISSAGVQFANIRGQLKRYSYDELIRYGQYFAGALLRAGVQRGEPVILVMTEPENAVIAILGCMIAGCPPAPVYPPMNLQAVSNFLKFIGHVADRSGATYLVADAQPYTFLGNVPHESPGIRGVEKFANLMRGSSSEDIRLEDRPVAFLQFTSGSTSAPKGVVVEHRGLAANLQMIRSASRMDHSSCVVTWLPVYHDMGLIGTVLNAITLPCNLVVLPPIVFLKKPRLWLELITQFRGTHTAAPNFAYGLCVRRVPNTDGIDLSSMTTFICGAEPVLPRTMESFVRHYSSNGLRPGAMVPAFGLAEATLAVSFSPHLRGLAVDEVDLEGLSHHRLANAAPQSLKTIRIASCGLPLDGLSIRIASESGEPLKDRHVGEIQITGASVSPGYVGDPDATRASRTADGWLRTGDLGYFANGELHPCGRIKDIIIIRGKNFHAHDLESLASEVHGVRTGNVVAFSIHEEGGESLVVVAESRDEKRDQEIAKGVRAHLAETAGITPDDVLIVPAGTLPKTSSGKLKRFETKSLYQSGRLFDSKPGTLTALAVAAKSTLGFLRKK